MDKVHVIHPLINSIDLSWEHGELQGVLVTFARRPDGREVRKLLKLPAQGAPLPANVTFLDVTDCGRDVTCAHLVGFDHVGAGDADCSDAEGR